MEEITCQAVSRILNVDPKLMWNLYQHRMEVMLQYLRLPKTIDVSYLCADEAHFISRKTKNRKGLFAKRYSPQFITNLVCPSEGKVLFNSMGRDSAALTTAMSALSPGQKLAVEKFAVDMHDPFISSIKSQCPNAEVVIDRFHLAQKVNEAFDKLRLANREINCGMLLVEYFHKALDQKKVKDFRKVLSRWYQLCRNTRFESFLKFAKTLRKYRRNIESYITSRLTTAVIEGLNNKIKVLKRMGYNYTNEVSFMRKVLQRCGYLNHLSINTDEFFFKWPYPA